MSRKDSDMWPSLVLAAFCIFACVYSSVNYISPDEMNAKLVIDPLENGTLTLRHLLKQRLDFQPQVHEFLVERIGKHLAKTKPTKPLLLSIHGPEYAGQTIFLDILGL